jgi:hypothetical protein
MSILTSATRPTKSRILYDATRTPSRALPFFAAGLVEPEPVAPATWTDAEETALRSCFDAEPTPETVAWNLHLESLARQEAEAPRPYRVGYCREDLEAYAAGRLITLDESLAREEAEEEARLLASMPAEVWESESAYRFEA